MSYIDVKITQEMIDNARRKAKQLGKLKGSIMKGQGNFIGFLGEEGVKRLLVDSYSENSYDYDLIFRGLRVEVKSKKCSDKPKSYYTCSITKAALDKQKFDVCVHVRVQVIDDRPVKMWVLGWLSKQDYVDNSKFWLKGDYDPSNNWTCRANCYNLEIFKLKHMKQIYE